MDPPGDGQIRRFIFSQSHANKAVGKTISRKDARAQRTAKDNSFIHFAILAASRPQPLSAFATLRLGVRCFLEVKME
jgi:hypothetical protein